MIGEIEQLMSLDWKTAIIVFLFLVILFPQIKDAIIKFCDAIGYEPRFIREKREQQEEIEAIKKQRDDDQEQYERYHQQSIQIRDGLERKIEEKTNGLDKKTDKIDEKITAIVESLNVIQKSLVKITIETKRKNILDFCAALSNKQKQNKEAFNEIFRTYEDYERILKENDMENGQTEESMKFISEVYQQMLRDGDLI